MEKAEPEDSRETLTVSLMEVSEVVQKAQRQQVNEIQHEILKDL